MLWTRFLQFIPASVSSSSHQASARDFGKVDHEIVQFAHEFSAATLAALVGLPRVRKYIDSGFLARKPVFVITGVRIARTSFAVSDVARSGRGVSGKAGVSVGEALGGGVGVGYAGEERSGDEIEHLYETAPGMVFAYRVHVVRVKGDGEVTEELFSHKSAFMTGGAEEGEELECVEVTPQVLRETLEGTVEVDRVDDSRSSGDLESGEMFVLATKA